VELGGGLHPRKNVEEATMPDKRFSRRSLFRKAAAAAPLIVAAGTLGRAGETPANQRVTLGHIGVGGRGGSLLREFLRCRGAQSVAVADAYKDRREAFARLTKGRACADFCELLARDDIDAVVIATPDHWHVPMAIAAARAKKDAYVEKPLGVSLEQDLVCRKVFSEQGRIFQYGTQQRSMAHCRRGCELVRNGRIGRLQAIEVTAPNGSSGGSTQTVPVPDNLDYESWCGPAPLKPYTADRCHPPGTYWIYDYSIGYLGGWGAHPLDIMVWGCDVDLGGPYSVEGTGEIPAAGLYDCVYNWDMKIQFAGGVRMTFKPGGDATKFIGSEGWVQISRARLDAEPKSLLDAAIAPGETRLVASDNHSQNFIDAVVSRRRPVSHLDDAVRSDTISQLCDIAARLKRRIMWDPKQATIVGDAEAAKLMRREMRPPWTL
jgi:hypothetical protein